MPLPCAFSIYRGDNSGCDEARGITTMHGLRSLKISHSKLNNSALTAILDGCPHLESLDLQFCFNIFVDGATPPSVPAVGWAGKLFSLKIETGPPHHRVPSSGKTAGTPPAVSGGRNVRGSSLASCSFSGRRRKGRRRKP
jgi:hypothetical protein